MLLLLFGYVHAQPVTPPPQSALPIPPPPPPPGPPPDFVDDDFDEGDDMPDDFDRAPRPSAAARDRDQSQMQTGPSSSNKSESEGPGGKFGESRSKIHFQVVRGQFWEKGAKRQRGKAE